MSNNLSYGASKNLSQLSPTDSFPRENGHVKSSQSMSDTNGSDVLHQSQLSIIFSPLAFDL